MSHRTRSSQVPSRNLRRPSDLSNSTRGFRWRDIKALNIYFENGDDKMFGNMVNVSYKQSLLLRNMDKDELFRVWDNDTLTNNKERALAKYISRVLIKEL